MLMIYLSFYRKKYPSQKRYAQAPAPALTSTSLPTIIVVASRSSQEESSMISRRQFLHLAAGGAAIRSGASRTVSALASESLVEHLLLLSPEQLAKLEEGRKKGLIELAPVSLPPDPNALNNHLGWPIATRAGDTLIVVHRRIPGHWKGLERTDDLHSYTMVWCDRQTPGRPGASLSTCARS